MGETNHLMLRLRFNMLLMLRSWLLQVSFETHGIVWTKNGYRNLGWLSSKRSKSASPKTALILAHALDLLEEIQYILCCWSLGKTW